MAKIIHDALVLSDSESRSLRANLLRPISNPMRDRFLDSIDDLEISFVNNGFTVEFPDLSIPCIEESIITSRRQIKIAGVYSYNSESVSIHCVYQDIANSLVRTIETVINKYQSSGKTNQCSDSKRFVSAA